MKDRPFEQSHEREVSEQTVTSPKINWIIAEGVNLITSKFFEEFMMPLQYAYGRMSEQANSTAGKTDCK